MFFGIDGCLVSCGFSAKENGLFLSVLTEGVWNLLFEIRTQHVGSVRTKNVERWRTWHIDIVVHILWSRSSIEVWCRWECIVVHHFFVQRGTHLVAFESACSLILDVSLWADYFLMSFVFGVRSSLLHFRHCRATIFGASVGSGKEHVRVYKLPHARSGWTSVQRPESA